MGHWANKLKQESEAKVKSLMDSVLPKDRELVTMWACKFIKEGTRPFEALSVAVDLYKEGNLTDFF